MTNIVLGGSTPDDGFELKSCRFGDGYLRKSFSSGTNPDKLTISCWVKPANLGAGTVTLFFGYTDANNYEKVCWNANGNLYWNRRVSGSVSFEAYTSMVFRDPASWYHLVLVYDSTDATTSSRIKFYVNGVLQTKSVDSPTPPTNLNSLLLSASCSIGYDELSGNANYRFKSYMAECHAIDGQALTPSSFGETDAATGQWKPIEYTGSYGTNGFYQKYGNTESAADMVDTSPKTTSTITFTTTAAITADVLIVGGGGGGGNKGGAGSGGSGAGGGAGGFRTVTGLALGSGTSHNIMVGFGAGGGNSGYRMSPGTVANALSQNAWGQGHNGGPSGFGDYTVDGGGGGGTQDTSARSYSVYGVYSGSTGNNFVGQTPLTGSGGGGGTEAFGAQGGTYGNEGGNYPTKANYCPCGGGGGAGAPGGDGVQNGNPGTGGDGLTNDYQTGSNITYAGGGGGGRQGNGSGYQAPGGAGGGGQGSNGGTGGNGTNNLGGGGGGGGNTSGNSQGGGSGGTGVVIVRYLANSAQATGGTITTYGSGGSQYYVHTFSTVNTRPTHQLVVRGDATQSDTQSKVGSSSFYFDGTSYDYLATWTCKSNDGSNNNIVNADFKHATDTAFCYEYWVRPSDVSGTQYHISNYCRSVASGGSGDGNDVELGMYTSGTDLRVRIDDTDRISGVATVAANTWYHVAVTRNTSNVVTLWLDGVSKGTYTAAQTVGNDRSYFFMGSRYQSTANEFEGFIDEFRLSNVVRYTSTFTPSTTAFVADANTLLLLQSDWGGGFGADSSGNNNGMSSVGIQACDQMVDSPTNNWCTLNPLDGNSTWSEGNLKVVTPS